MDIRNTRGMPVRKTIRLIIVFFYFSSIINCVVAQETPQVLDGALYFPKSRISIPITEGSSYRIFPTKKRIVFINEEKKGKPFSEYTREYVLRFYDYYGNEIAQPIMITGNFIFLFSEDKQRIIIGQKYGMDKSYLFDLDGNQIDILIHDTEVKDVGITPDDKYVWFVANKIRTIKEGETPLYTTFSELIPYNHLMIFDTVTGNLYKDYAVDGTGFELTVDNVKYVFSFSRADFPG